MYLEQGALKISPVLSSRVIMTLLTQKYKAAAEILCQIDKNKLPELSSNELLMLVKTPSYRLLLEKTYTQLIGKTIIANSFFENLSKLKIKRNSLRSTPNSKYNLIAPSPFITSLIKPQKSSNNIYHNCTSIVCQIFEKFSIFSKLSQKSPIKKPTNMEVAVVSKALKDLGTISREPIEDIALNIRFIAIIESSDKSSSLRTLSCSFGYLPGIFFLNSCIFEDPAYLMECIYHETLHAKWFNTYHAYYLLKFEMLNSVNKFICPWAKHSSEKVWSFGRAIAAYHVYCHLLPFHRLVVEKKINHYEWSIKRIPIIREKLNMLQEYVQSTGDTGLTELGIQYFTLLGKIAEL